MQAKTGANKKLIILALLIGLVLGGFLFSRTEKPTPPQKNVLYFSHSGTLGGLDGTKGWGISLGLRYGGETVTVELSSVYEVKVCLAKTSKTELDGLYLYRQGFSRKEVDNLYQLIETGKLPGGTAFPLDAAACMQDALLKSGKVSFTIPSVEHYTIVVGKAAGYIATSFKVDITVS